VERQYRGALGRLADQARKTADPAGARLLEAWLPSPPACGETLFVASDLYAPWRSRLPAGGDFTEGSSSSSDSWQPDWRALREKIAQQYYHLAVEACRRNQVGLAMRLATRAVREAPDHRLARRLLGYRRVGKSWGGGYAERMISSGRIWDPEYGWVREQTIDRLRAGQCPLGRQWISAEQDKLRHQTIDQGWHVRTDHYEIVTNHSRLAAVELAVNLEMVYQIWRQLFGEYFLSSKQLLQRLDGKQGASHRRKPFQVRYYRSRREYNEHLRHLQPRIDMTLGIYFDALHQTHFFYGPQQDAGTMYHEAVHQLFQETRGPSQKRTTSQLAARANAWVVEGVACYFESLTAHSLMEHPTGETSIPAARAPRRPGEFYTVGTPAAGRLPAARHRRLVDSFYMPLREFSALSARDLQRHDQIARLYSQAAGVTTFLMHYQGGLYRQALVQYLRAVYAGRDKPATLAEVTGRSFEQLDEQYGEFLRRLP